MTDKKILHNDGDFSMRIYGECLAEYAQPASCDLELIRNSTGVVVATGDYLAGYTPPHSSCYQRGLVHISNSDFSSWHRIPKRGHKLTQIKLLMTDYRRWEEATDDEKANYEYTSK